MATEDEIRAKRATGDLDQVPFTASLNADWGDTGGEQNVYQLVPIGTVTAKCQFAKPVAGKGEWATSDGTESGTGFQYLEACIGPFKRVIISSGNGFFRLDP